MDEESLAIQIQADITQFVESMKIANDEMGRFVDFGVDAMQRSTRMNTEYQESLKQVTEQMRAQMEIAGLLTDAEKREAQAQKEAVQLIIAENRQKAMMLAELAKQELADKTAKAKEFDAVQKQAVKDALELEKQANVEKKRLAQELIAENRQKARLLTEIERQEYLDAKQAQKEFLELEKEKNRQTVELAKQRAELLNQIGNNIKSVGSTIANVAVGSLNVVRNIISGVVQLGVGAVQAIGSAINAFKSGLSALAQGLGVIAAPIAAVIGLGIQTASKAQDAWARLAAVQQSSIAINDTLQDRQAGYYNAMNATTQEVDKLRKSLENKTNSLERAQFVWDHAAKRTDSMRVNLEYWRNEVNNVTAALGKASGSHKVWLDFKEADGKVTHMTTQQIAEMAAGLERYTRFTQEDIIAGTAWAEMYTNISAKIMPDVISTATDLASTMGVDLKTAVVDIGEALQDPIKGWSRLRQVGVQFTDDERKKMEQLVKSGKLLDAQQMILQRLKLQFEGAAQAAGTTFSGSLEILTNNLRRFVEPIGERVIPGIQRLIDAGLNFFRNFGTFDSALVDAATGFVGLATGVGLAATAVNLLLSPVGLVIAGIAGIKLAIDNNLGGLGDTFRGIYNLVKPEIDKITGAIKSIMDAFNFQPENDPAFLDKMKKTPANPNIQSRRWSEQDSGTPAAKVSDVPGLMKQKAQNAYADNLKETITGAASSIIESLKSMLEKVSSWAVKEGQRLFKDAFKSLFGIDFSTAMANVENIFKPGSPARQVLDKIADDLKIVFENLKGADWKGFTEGIVKFGLALLGLGVLGVGELLKVISEAIRKFVDAIAEANKGDWTNLIKIIGAIAIGFAVIALATQAAGVISAVAVAMWALVSPVLLAAAPLIVIAGALWWLWDNKDAIGKALKGYEPMFDALGITIRRGALAAMKEFLKVVAEVLKLAAVAADVMGDTDLAKKLAQGWLDIQAMTKDEELPRIRDTGGGSSVNAAAIARVPQSNTGGNTTIIVDRVIVDKVDNYNKIFEQIQKTSKQQRTPIIEPKVKLTYA